MPYTQISHVPGHSLSDYQAVAGVLGPQTPEGRLALIVGEADGALHIIDVWDSKAYADRFAAEQLMPAFRRAGVTPGPEEAYIEFDVTGTAVPSLPAAQVLGSSVGQSARRHCEREHPGDG